MAKPLRHLVIRHKGVEVYRTFVDGRPEKGATPHHFRTVDLPKLAVHPSDFDIRALPPALVARHGLDGRAPDSTALRAALAEAIDAGLVTAAGGPAREATR